MPSTYLRSNFLKDNKETKEKHLKNERKYQKNQEASLEIMKKGCNTMTAGITYLINNSKRTNNESILSTNTVKALELKATNERIDKYEDTIKVLLNKIEDQNIRITKLEEANKKNISKELFPALEEPSTTKVNKSTKAKTYLPLK